MQQNSEVAERLVSIAKELMQVADLLGKATKEPLFPQDAVRKVTDGICLGCGKRKSEVKGEFRRGRCPSCSTKINKVIKQNPLVEWQAIQDGQLAPLHYSPEPDPLDAVVAKAEALANSHYAEPAVALQKVKPSRRTRKR